MMWAKSERGVLRKGPPEAVSQICFTSCGVPPRMALMDGVVFGVDGKQSYVMLAGGSDDELAGGYEALFVGEADGFAGADCGVGGFESGYAYDGGDYEVDFGKGGDVDGAGGAVDYFDVGDAFGFEAGLQLEARASVAREMTWGRQRRHWAKATSMLVPAARETTW